MHGGHESPGVVTASSRHQGGAHVLMADGAVKYITDSIEAGNSGGTTIFENYGGAGNDSKAIDPNAVPGAQSPFGLWGALGTRANKETIEEEF